jgi:hypothetical protein
VADRSRVEVTARLRGARKFAADAKMDARAVDSIGDAAQRTDDKIAGLNARAMLFRNAVGLVKFPAMVAGLGLATQGAAALGAGVAGLTAGLAPLSGLMVAYPALGFAAAQGLGATAFAMNGVLDAVGGLNSKMDPKKLGMLSAGAQQFVIGLDKMKAPIRALQSATQAGLFPGLTSAVGTLQPVLHTFQSEMKATGASVGWVAQRAADFVKGSGSDLQLLAGRNATYIRRMGLSGVLLAHALVDVLVAAGPLVDWLTKGAVSLASWVSHAAHAGRESGRLAGFFAQTRDVASHLGHILLNVGGALLGIGRAAAPLGHDMLTTIQSVTAGWNRWANSTTGQGDMRRYFADMKAPLWEMGRLVRDLVKAFVGLGHNADLAPLLHQVRTELLPVLAAVTASTTSSFGPVMVDALTNVAKLAAALSGGVGPLTLFVGGISAMAQGLSAVLDFVPGAKELVVTLGTIGLAAKLMPFAAWATGFTKVKAGVTALVGGYRALVLGMGTMKAVYIANTGVTNASNLAVLRHVAATKLAAAGARVMAVAQGVLNVVTAAFPGIAIAAAIAAVGVAFYMAYTKVKWFHNAVNAVWGFIKNHWGLLASIIAPISIPIVLLIKHFDALKSAGSSAFSGIKTAVGGAITWIGKKIDWLLGKVDGLLDKLNGVPGMGIAKKGAHLLGKGADAAGGILKHIPGLASGGVVRVPGATLVGENGPELLSLDRGSRVDPLPRLAQGMAQRREAASAPSIGGALADAETRAIEVRIPVHLDGRVIYEAVGRVARDRAARR